jgi:hypothetical protein
MVAATNGQDSTTVTTPSATTSPAHHSKPQTTTLSVYCSRTQTQLARP